MLDKECIQQVLGSLIKCPQLLSEVDKYNLTLSSFATNSVNCFLRFLDSLESIE